MSDERLRALETAVTAMNATLTQIATMLLGNGQPGFIADTRNAITSLKAWRSYFAALTFLTLGIGGTLLAMHLK